ncbi:class B sortase [Virgibacillus litoralis]|uniref:Sortase B n=1 Tax=Virgibacillus litoralis TaxID=578221 RepID=A0ABS4HBM5_9BACI|nr:class B sortase [Virgibacillus litoralis]MBP1948322.1 sortase B [Virgibacillus litoralis]
MILIIFTSLIVIVYASYSLYEDLHTYKVSAKKYQKVEKIYQYRNDPVTRLTSINDDYVGWIKIPGTQINYPVVMGDNNEFYLTHNYYKEEDKVGAIFMDFRNSIEELDNNLILYGHNMKDDSMFGAVLDYMDEDFFRKNRIIQFELQGRSIEWEVFSVYKTTDLDWMETEFSTDDKFDNFASTIKEQSLFTNQTNIDETDTIVTLSTCTVRNGEERVIVHAKLKDAGEYNQ